MAGQPWAGGTLQAGGGGAGSATWSWWRQQTPGRLFPALQVSVVQGIFSEQGQETSTSAPSFQTGQEGVGVAGGQPGSTPP